MVSQHANKFPCLAQSQFCWLCWSRLLLFIVSQRDLDIKESLQQRWHWSSSWVYWISIYFSISSPHLLAVLSSTYASTFCLFLVLCLAISSSLAIDYCSKDLKCQRTPHVACNNPLFEGGWGSECSDPELIEMTDEMKQGLVDMHNKYRNQHANGETPHYEPATRMATMVGVFVESFFLELKRKSQIILIVIIDFVWSVGTMIWPSLLRRMCAVVIMAMTHARTPVSEKSVISSPR